MNKMYIQDTMPIQVYERFDNEGDDDRKEEKEGENEGDERDGVRGDLWEEITWDFLRPDWRKTHEGRTLPRMGWLLKCNFRMPAHGILRFMHPTKDDEATEFMYDTPTIKLPHFTPGVIKQKSFTPELKKEWEALPKMWHCSIGPVTLTCTKDILDAMESSVFGELYIYRPTELSFD